MNINKSSFSPLRLKVARERRGMTCKELADLVQVTPDAITKFEKGRCLPAPETVRALVFKLGFPEAWFFGHDFELLDVKAPSFRARRSLSAKLRDKATRTGDIAASVISPALHQRFVLPETQIPDLSQHPPPEAATLLRHEWKLGQGPISNMIHLMESKGVECFWMQEDSPSLDAWSVWHNERPFVIFNAHTQAGCRARFDAAHELGHLVLHRHAPIIDGLQLEAEANLFAAWFLMPGEQFRAECPRYPILNQFYPLKKRWGTSIACQIMHCRTLGVFSEWDTRRAFQEISSRGWRKQEPRDVAIERETSLVQKSIAGRLEKKGLGAGDLAREVLLAKSDLCELLPGLKSEASTPEREEKQFGHLRLVA